MANKIENLELEIKHFMAFCDALPGYSKLCQTTVLTLLEMNIVEVASAFEAALAHLGGHTVTSRDHCDLSDGSDAKLSTVRTFSYGRSYSAPVTNIAGKTGDLLVQVYERKQDRFYWFRIPHWSYKDIPATSNIEIPFDLDGNPRVAQRARINWWQFRVSSFEELAIGG